MSERRTIILREHETVTTTLTQGELTELLFAGKGAIEIAPTTEIGRYRIKARAMVGTIASSQIQVLIRPKIPIENVFLLLEPSRVPIDLRTELVGFGAHEDVAPAFAAFFSRLLEQTLARGMRRDYVAFEEALVAVRGRIRMDRQMRSAVVSPIACDFEEYSIDTPHNRVLKAATLKLSQLSGIGAQTRSALRHLLLWFGEVGDNPPMVEAVLRQGFSRMDAHYEPAVRLACLVLGGRSLDHRIGDVTASTFLIDMNRTFEKFLEVRLASALEGDLSVSPQHRVHFDHARSVRIEPDLVFMDGLAPVFVGDAKYKLGSPASGASPDLFQLLAYTTVLDLPEGVLVYAQSEEEIPNTLVEVVNGDKRLHIRRIDLQGDARSIRRSVDELAAWISARARVVPMP